VETLWGSFTTKKRPGVCSSSLTNTGKSAPRSSKPSWRSTKGVSDLGNVLGSGLEEVETRFLGAEKSLETGFVHFSGGLRGDLRYFRVESESRSGSFCVLLV